MSALLAACPSYREAWLRLENEWPASEGRGVYIDAGAFAGHLVAMLARDETNEFTSVFQAVEGLLKDPDESVRYATKVGLLEDVGNIASNSRDWAFAARFRAWFGPATSQAWDELHREWGTTDSG
jgi:hypothetical protein